MRHQDTKAQRIIKKDKGIVVIGYFCKKIRGLDKKWRIFIFSAAFADDYGDEIS